MTGNALILEQPSKFLEKEKGANVGKNRKEGTQASFEESHGIRLLYIFAAK